MWTSTGNPGATASRASVTAREIPPQQGTSIRTTVIEAGPASAIRSKIGRAHV